MSNEAAVRIAGVINGVMGTRHTGTHLADEVLVALAEAGFRVVSADAVVLNRDDIPDGLPSDLALTAHVWEETIGTRWSEPIRAAVRLLSGGASPAESERGEG